MTSVLKRKSFDKPAWTISTALGVIALTLLIPLAIWLLVYGLVKLGALPIPLAKLIFGRSTTAALVRILISFSIELSLLYWVKRRYKLKLADFGFRKFNVLQAVLVIIAMFIIFLVLLFVAYLLIAVLLPQINLDEAQKSGFELGRHGVGLVGSFIVTVMMAPIVEEVYFRGFLLPAFSSKWGDLSGMVLSSLIFGILHMQINVGIYTFILGMILSTMYIRFKSIGPGILLHIINNALAFFVLLKL